MTLVIWDRETHWSPLGKATQIILRSRYQDILRKDYQAILDLQAALVIRAVMVILVVLVTVGTLLNNMWITRFLAVAIQAMRKSIMWALVRSITMALVKTIMVVLAISMMNITQVGLMSGKVFLVGPMKIFQVLLMSVIRGEQTTIQSILMMITSLQAILMNIFQVTSTTIQVVLMGHIMMIMGIQSIPIDGSMVIQTTVIMMSTILVILMNTNGIQAVQILFSPMVALITGAMGLVVMMMVHMVTEEWTPSMKIGEKKEISIPETEPTC